MSERESVCVSKCVCISFCGREKDSHEKQHLRVRYPISFLYIIMLLSYIGFCTNSRSAMRGRLFFNMYVYYLSKYYELFDTAILILKKVLPNSF